MFPKDFSRVCVLYPFFKMMQWQNNRFLKTIDISDFNFANYCFTTKTLFHVMFLRCYLFIFSPTFHQYNYLVSMRHIYAMRYNVTYT